MKIKIPLHEIEASRDELDALRISDYYVPLTDAKRCCLKAIQTSNALRNFVIESPG